MSQRNETGTPACSENGTLYVAIEISRTSWVVGIKSPVNERNRSAFDRRRGHLCAAGSDPAASRQGRARSEPLRARLRWLLAGPGSTAPLGLKRFSWIPRAGR